MTLPITKGAFKPGGAAGSWRGSIVLVAVLILAGEGRAQDAPEGPQASAVASVEVRPATAEAQVGQEIRFTAVGKDAAGNEVAAPVGAWFALPFDAAAADSSDRVTVYQPGTVQVVAVVGGQAGFATVTVGPPPVTAVEIPPPAGPLVVGGSLRLEATPMARGAPRRDVAVAWSSSAPDVATVDAAGLVTGVAPGRATIRGEAVGDGGAGDGAAGGAGADGEVTLEVVENPVARIAVEPAAAEARTGDVVRFAARAQDTEGRAVERPFVRWTVSGEPGATVDPDGGFFAERAGTYTVTAASGDHAAVGSVVVRPRNAERTLEVVGRAPVDSLQAAEQWVIGDHLYLASIADRVWVYDISDPATPVKTDSLLVDARIVNDVSTTADGRIGVLTREGASNRRNGIVFFDASDPAHPEIVSEYTETVTGGVHSAFIDGHHVS